MLRKKILSISLAGFIIASVLLGCGSSTVVPEGTEKGLNEAASGAEEIQMCIRDSYCICGDFECDI